MMIKANHFTLETTLEALLEVEEEWLAATATEYRALTDEAPSDVEMEDEGPTPRPVKKDSKSQLLDAEEDENSSEEEPFRSPLTRLRRKRIVFRSPLTRLRRKRIVIISESETEGPTAKEKQVEMRGKNNVRHVWL